MTKELLKQSLKEFQREYVKDFLKKFVDDSREASLGNFLEVDFIS